MVTVQEYITFIDKYPNYGGDAQYRDVYIWLRSYLASGNVQAVVQYSKFKDLRKVIALGFLADFAPLQEHQTSASTSVIAAAWFIDAVWFNRIKEQLGFWRNPSINMPNVGDLVPRPLSISASAGSGASASHIQAARLVQPSVAAAGSLPGDVGPSSAGSASAVDVADVEAPVHPRVGAMVSGSDADILQRVDKIRRLEVPVVGYLESEISAARMANRQEGSSFIPGTSTLNVRENEWVFILWSDTSVPDFLKNNPADIIRPAGGSLSHLVHAEMKNIILARCIKVSYNATEWNDLRASVIEFNSKARLANLKRRTRMSKDEVAMNTRAIAEKSEEEKKEMDVDGWKAKTLDSNPDLYVIVVEYWRRKGKGDERVTDVTTDNFWGPFIPEAIDIRRNNVSDMTLERGLISIDNVFCTVPLNAKKPYNPNSNSVQLTRAMKKQLCCLPSRGGYFPYFGAVTEEIAQVLAPNAVAVAQAPVVIASEPARLEAIPATESEPDSSSESSASEAEPGSEPDDHGPLPSAPRRRLVDKAPVIVVPVPVQVAVPIQRRKVVVRTGPDQPMSAPLADVFNPDFDGLAQRSSRDGSSAAESDIFQSYTDAVSSATPALESQSKRRNIPGSSIAAHRLRRDETKRIGTPRSTPPDSSSMFNKPSRTIVRVPKGYAQSSQSSMPPPEFDMKTSRTQGTYVVVKPTAEEIEEYGDRFWVGKLLVDGPERGGLFTVKWMKSWYMRKVEGRDPEFGMYKIWNNKRATISAKDVKYAFGKLSKQSKLMKKDEDAIRVVFAIDR